jgi:hypothetical protein
MTRNGSHSKVLVAVAVLFLGSCAGPAVEATTPLFVSAAPRESDIPPANQPGPRAEVTGTEGLDAAEARREYSAAAQRLRECPNDGRIPVRIRVKKEDGRTSISFAESVPPLSPESRRCVLDAMSTVEVPDVASDASPSNKPSGFTAFILLSW